MSSKLHSQRTRPRDRDVLWVFGDDVQRPELVSATGHAAQLKRSHLHQHGEYIDQSKRAGDPDDFYQSRKPSSWRTPEYRIDPSSGFSDRKLYEW